MASDELFGPAEIELLTGGAVSPTDLRNWVRDARFNTRLDEPKAGKPRSYPVAAVYEAALLSAFSRFSVPLATAQRWNCDLLSKISAGAPVPLIAVVPDNDEFVTFSDTTIPVGDFIGLFGGFEVVGRLARSRGEVEISDAQKPIALAIVNLPEIIRRVDDLLAKR